jgi:CRP/FNR family transcriptional regulator, cyclic AMP receptor protein
MLRGEKAKLTSSARASVSLVNNLRGTLQPSDASNGLQSFERSLSGFHVPQRLIGDLLEHHTVLSFAKDSRLYDRGSPADVLYWVRTGLVLVSVYFPEENGRGILVRLAGPGELIGFADFIDDRGRRCQAFEAYAKTNCQVALVTREHLHKVLKALEPEDLVLLLEQLNTAWCAEMTQRLKSLVIDYRRRLELVFADLAERCGVEDSRGVMLTPELNHLDFAHMLGCSRPMVGRLIADMINQGILIQHNRRYILTRDLRSENPVGQSLRQARTTQDRRTGGVAERTSADTFAPKDGRSRGLEHGRRVQKSSVADDREHR